MKKLKLNDKLLKESLIGPVSKIKSSYVPELETGRTTILTNDQIADSMERKVELSLLQRSCRSCPYYFNRSPKEHYCLHDGTSTVSYVNYNFFFHKAYSMTELFSKCPLQAWGSRVKELIISSCSACPHAYALSAENRDESSRSQKRNRYAVHCRFLKEPLYYSNTILFRENLFLFINDKFEFSLIPDNCPLLRVKKGPIMEYNGSVVLLESKSLESKIKENSFFSLEETEEDDEDVE